MMMSMYVKWVETYKCGELNDVCAVAYESKKQERNSRKRYCKWYENYFGVPTEKKSETTKVDWEWCEANRPQVFVARPRIPTGWYNWEDYKRIVGRGC